MITKHLLRDIFYYCTNMSTSRFRRESYLVQGQSFHVVDRYVKKSDNKKKNIVITFDGTGGEPGWAAQEASHLIEHYTNAGGLSNICKIHLISGGTVDNSSNVFDDQISLYYKGVGTWGADSVIGGLLQGYKSLFDAGAMKVIYERAYRHLKQIYQPGDKIYIFGFSRGAATARLFASHLDKERNKIDGVTPEVAFLGVFDTVVQSSDAGYCEDIDHTDVDRKDTALPACVKRAVHLVSIDELREPFRPTLFNQDPRVTEVWCPGNHSDVGGGYYHDGLSDITLTAMLKEAELAGMKTRKITKDTPHSTICGEVEIKDFDEFDKDMEICPDALEPDVHDENSLVFWKINWQKGFKHRIVCAVKDDDNTTDTPVLIMEAALERINNWNPTDPSVPRNFQYKPYTGSVYRPENLIGVPHKIVTVGDKGITVVEGKTIVVEL